MPAGVYPLGGSGRHAREAQLIPNKVASAQARLYFICHPGGGLLPSASGDSPSEEGSADEIKAPNPAMAIAQYAVLVVGLVMVLIGVLVMVANSKVT